MVRELKNLIKQANEASEAYYVYDKPIMTDKQYDALLDRIQELENETGVVIANSPLHKVQGRVLEGFVREKHSKPMLSAKKTKDVNEIIPFVRKSKSYCSWKLDGITLVVRYRNGKLEKSITRGGGEDGEVVTEQSKTIVNLPHKIPYMGDLELRGECMISWENYKSLQDNTIEELGHPRNVAGGGVRNLDSNVTASRNLEFVVFECISDLGYSSKMQTLNKLEEWGFDVVEREYCSDKEVSNMLEKFNPEEYKFPVDGLIFEYDDYEYSESLGATAHHEGCRIALKWEDETKETVIKDIEWSVTRNSINPVAIFDTVKLESSDVSRASLHNISYMENLQIGIGDTVTVYLANKIIPQIDENLTRNGVLKVPTQCPCCGHDTEIRQENESRVLVCTNSDCAAKKISLLCNFVSKKAMDIRGLSEATLTQFVELGLIKNYSDIYHLSEHRSEIEKLDGFGKKSVDKLLESIEDSREVTLDKFITSLGINGVGTSQGVVIAKFLEHDKDKMLEAFSKRTSYTKIQGIGDVLSSNINKFVAANHDMIVSLCNELKFVANNETVQEVEAIAGKSFCVTGSVHMFKNRKELSDYIVQHGGKIVSSVSSKTDYLVCNEQSTSSKYKKATQLNIPILTEEEVVKIIES